MFVKVENHRPSRSAAVAAVTRHDGRRGEAGFSVIELVMATLLFTIVTGAIYGLMEAARSDRHTTNQRVEVMQNLRVALNAMGRDTLNAGYKVRREGGMVPGDALFSMLGMPYTTSSIDFLSPVVSGRNINANTLTGATALTANATDQITFISIDTTFNKGQAVPLQNISANGDNVLIDHKGPDGVPNTADDISNTVCNVGDIVVIQSSVGAAIGMVTDLPGGPPVVHFKSSAPWGINEPANDGGVGNSANPLNVIRKVMRDNANNTVRPTTMIRINVFTYKVLSDGTLVRVKYGMNSPTGLEESALAFNVEDMAIEYVLDDGTITTDPMAGADNITGNGDDTPDALRKVRQVRVTLRACGNENDRRNNQPFRITLTSTFNTRNLGYVNGRV